MNEEILWALAGRLPAPGAFAVFDFDNTCIAGDIGEAVWGHLIETGHADPSLNVQYDALVGQGNVREAYLLYATMVAGLTPGTLRKAACHVLEHSEIKPRPSVLELMDFLKRNGVAVWIISASHEVTVRAALERFGIAAHLIGVRNRMQNGRYTGAVEEPVPIFEGKVACMRAHIHPAHNPLLVIDDNPSGIAILETADIKVVVDHHQQFAAYARGRGWLVL